MGGGGVSLSYLYIQKMNFLGLLGTLPTIINVELNFSYFQKILNKSQLDFFEFSKSEYSERRFLFTYTRISILYRLYIQIKVRFFCSIIETFHISLIREVIQVYLIHV